MAIAVGTTLGRYEIRSLLGAGGMGEVYLAHDTQLRRPVALKFLPANFTMDEDRLRRFEQEAYAASALNHPNILTIYEIGQFDATRFMAMEYVEGETLRQHLARAHAHSVEGQLHGGGIKLHEALDIAIQIASALSASQTAGIAHRDIKPENLMLRRDGYLKVLDFGLAKLTERPATTDTEAPTRAMVNTSPGAVMGTVNYMSPEQASGQAVDARTDIWSLGVLLYEMITGRMPFEGPTPSHVIVSILEKDPPLLTRYLTDAPEALEWIVTKALTKNPDERYQTAREMLTDLRRLKQRLDASAEMERSIAPDAGGPGSQTMSSSSQLGASTIGGPGAEQKTLPAGAPTVSSAEYLVNSVSRHKLGLGIAVLVLIAALGVVLWSKMRAVPAHTFRKVRMSQLTNTAKANLATISPDGKYAVHVIGDGTLTSLWVRQVATSSNVQIVPPAESRYIGLTFSKDGNYVYYVVYEKNSPLGIVYQIPVLGGAPRKIIEDVDTPITFSPSGDRFAWVRNFPQSGETALMVAASDGSGPQKIASLARPKRFLANQANGPAWALEGELIACPVAGPENGLDRSTIKLFDAKSGIETEVTPQRWAALQQIAWAPRGGGMLVSAQEVQGGRNQIWHVAYPGGTVDRVTNDLNNYSGVSISSDGTNIATVQTQVSSSVWFMSIADTDSAVKVTSGTNEGGRGLTFMPDGRIVYTVGGAASDIFLVNPDGSNPLQLTANAAVNSAPSVSADGRVIVFVSNRAGAPHIWRMDSDGTNVKQLTNGIAEVNPRISPDGQWVYFQSINDLGFWKVSTDGGTPAQVSNRLVAQPAISPDGKLAACRYREQDLSAFKLGIIDLATGEVVKVIDQTSDGTLNWSADGRAVLYIDRRNGVSNIWSQTIDGSAPKELTNFKSDLIFTFDVSKDGKSLALARGTTANDVVLITDAGE
ncbi:MAG TPA: protein kinase [Pyrinomonadaceae bacterium]|jgi:serine/threonine protein kinase/Tol biopolymer transport system component